ncbi:hypothetical protein [Cellulosimicrobium sp. TH-20]|uniref:hypothetical protein n=1 Tax=Cellulosimicrobium sp. TH-20 TaxID=1980001 RepID=UPI0011AAD5FC|nr:hypothetical protein [Cellulosimicrobium sp. TH-20]
MEEQDDLVASAELFRTKSRGRLHIRGCSHLVDTIDLVEADDRDRVELDLCSECDKEIHGVGRTEYASLDEAFEALRFPVENRPLMRDIAGLVSFTKVWAPQSRSYIGVGHLDGRPAVAYFNRRFVDVRLSDGGYKRHEMPNFTRGVGGVVKAGVAERPVVMCPSCSTQLPATLVCDNCD